MTAIPPGTELWVLAKENAGDYRDHDPDIDLGLFTSQEAAQDEVNRLNQEWVDDLNKGKTRSYEKAKAEYELKVQQNAAMETAGLPKIHSWLTPPQEPTKIELKDIRYLPYSVWDAAKVVR